MIAATRQWLALLAIFFVVAVTAAAAAAGAPATGSVEEIIVTGKIDIDMKMPEKIRQGVRVVLNSGEFETLMRKDGSFRFPSGVGRGVYTLDVLSADLLFPQYKLDTRNPKRIRALQYAFPGAQKVRLVDEGSCIVEGVRGVVERRFQLTANPPHDRNRSRQSTRSTSNR